MPKLEIEYDFAKIKIYVPLDSMMQSLSYASNK